MEHRLRPASELDREFLFMLHCITMRDAIEATWGWDKAWQRTAFDRRFAVQNVSIIEATNFDVGGLWIEWKPDSLYIHEIQIFPDYQNQGFGTAVTQDVVGQAVSRMLPVELSVVPANPRAKHLYKRLGFVVTSVESPFIQMRYDAHLV